MTAVVAIASAQVEADKRLIQFLTYEDYLDSLLIGQDHCFLQNTHTARAIAELGYRSTGETLSREQFERRRAAVVEYLYPSFIPYTLASDDSPVKPDPFLLELALRERPNRMGMLSTIIFLRHFTKTGFEVSGYIDYGERLVNEDWKPFFKGLQRLWPRPTDLGYYHWRIDKSACNDSKNYKVIIDPKKGLQFQNRYDRKVICVDPAVPPGSNSTRLRIHTDLYENVILYDHVVMQRI
ncbi:hypothetical protein Trydic_g10473 [Trypoxylus dichotomus]